MNINKQKAPSGVCREPNMVVPALISGLAAVALFFDEKAAEIVGQILVTFGP